MDLETRSIMVTPSDVLEYLFCPRFIYFMYCLAIPQREEKRYKVQKGREIHKERLKQNPDYLRKKLGCVRRENDVYLASEKHHVKGKVDEVLFLEDGTAAPMDYKFAEFKGTIYRTLHYQSVLYGLLIRENYGVEVKRGFLCYTRSRSLVKEIEFSAKDFDDACEVLRKVVSIIQTGKLPSRASSKARCVDCCYKNICV